MDINSTHNSLRKFHLIDTRVEIMEVEKVKCESRPLNNKTQVRRCRRLHNKLSL